MQTISRISRIIADMTGLPTEEIHAGQALGTVPVPNFHDREGRQTPLDLDSLDRIQLAMKIEDEFGIDLTDDEVDKPELAYVAGLAAFVQGKIDAKQVSQAA